MMRRVLALSVGLAVLTGCQPLPVTPTQPGAIAPVTSAGGSPSAPSTSGDQPASPNGPNGPTSPGDTATPPSAEPGRRPGGGSRPVVDGPTGPGITLSGNLARPHRGTLEPAALELMTLESPQLGPDGDFPASFTYPYYEELLMELFVTSQLPPGWTPPPDWIDGMPPEDWDGTLPPGYELPDDWEPQDPEEMPEYLEAIESPTLTWSGAPAGTQSFVVMFEDMDEFRRFNYRRPVHWLVYDIPASATGISKHDRPDGAKDGLSTVETLGWEPVSFENEEGGTHDMRFTIYALSAMLDLPEGASPVEVRNAMQGKILKVGILDGTLYIPEEDEE